MTYRVAVAGASGYAGGELLRLLLAHPQFEVGALTAGSNAGQRLGGLQPQLPQLANRRLEPTNAQVLADHDVVFLALPHGASSQLVAQLPASVVVVDCSADHRLIDAQDWQQFYGGDYAPAWPYGLPELMLADGAKQRTQLRRVNRIAVPGCYPSAISLALAPGFAAGVLEPDVVAVAASGTSGAGKTLQPHLLASEVVGSMSPYGVGGVHRHTPEIEQNLTAAAGCAVQVSFTPTLAPMSRGILATCTAHLSSEAADDPDEVRAIWQRAYADEPFVHVLPAGCWPRTADTFAANTAMIQIAVDPRTRRVVVCAAIDNLTKGTAGGAIQSTNCALSLPETLGLPIAGVAP